MHAHRPEPQNWKVSTGDYSQDQRETAWQQAMQKVYLSIQDHQDGGIDGEINVKKTPLGLDFVLISGSPQTIIGNYPVSSESLWLAVIIEGNANLEINHHQMSFNPGSILYGSCGNIDHIRLHMESDFKILTIEIPNTIFYKRLINPLSISTGILPSHQGISKILFEFLLSVGNEMDNLSPHKFHSLDTALTELFLTSLAENRPVYNFSSSLNAQLFQRICDSIEAELTNEQLGLEMVAHMNKVSSRYIQKLFQEAGLKFNQYIRERRVDLCKRDLANLNYQHLSISEICYRWGFNDLAYFSRVFSQQVGSSPRSYREKIKRYS